MVNAEKCSFGRAEVSFLGHVVNDQGIRPLQTKVKAVTEYPNPRTKLKLKRFLGMINSYRRFIPNCAEVAASLTPLTGGRNGPIEMFTEKLAAFERLSCLAQAITLAFPCPDAQLSLMVDAPKTAIGAVLNQGEGGHQQPLAFFSNALGPTEQRYSIFGRELLAACLSAKEFRHYEEGGRLLAFTDHKPLISAMASHSSKYTEREIRQLDFLCQFGHYSARGSRSRNTSLW